MLCRRRRRAYFFTFVRACVFYPFYKILSIFVDKKTPQNVPVVCSSSSSSARVARRERVHHGYIVDVRRAVVVQDRRDVCHVFLASRDRGRVGRSTMRIDYDERVVVVVVVVD